MVIFAGIDLLAKFYAGSDAGKIRPRFEEFSKSYLDLQIDGESGDLWNVRNSFMHSFGLYNKGVKKKVVLLESASDPHDKQRVVNSTDERLTVYLVTLFCAFTRAIGMYKSDLLNSSDLEPKFDAIFPNYGSILIG